MGLRNFLIKAKPTLAILLWFYCTVATPSVELEEYTLFRIGSGSLGGTYFPVANLIASVLSGNADCQDNETCGVPDLLAVAQIANGSVANVLDLAEGVLEAGLAQADVAYAAYSGSGVFTANGPYPDLRAIANLYPETIHLVVSAASDIYTVEDLAGKRVSLAELGSGSMLGARHVLNAYGLQEDQLQAFYLKPELSAVAMREQRLDAFFVIVGHPAVAIADLAEKYSIRLIPIDGLKAQALKEEEPYFFSATIPADVYRGVEKTLTLAVGAQLLVSAQLDEELVYRVTRALWDSYTYKILTEGHPTGREIRLQRALEGVAIPLHPGAERFYREVGLLAAALSQP